MEERIDDGLADWYLRGDYAILLKPTKDGRIEILKEEIIDDFNLQAHRVETLGFITRKEIEKHLEELKKKIFW